MKNVMYNSEDGDDESLGSLDSVDSDYSSKDGEGSSGDEDSVPHSTASKAMRIAHTESKFVLCSKFTAYIVLFLSAVAAGVAAFYFTREQEKQDFYRDFDLYANEIVRSSRANAVSKVEVAQSVAIGITSYASDREQSFPFVTLPDFEKRVGKARALSDSEIISWSPLVADADREEWEAYSAANGQWLRESLVELGMGDTPAFISPRIIDGVGTPVDGPIFTNEDAGPVRNMYAVLWQTSPVYLNGAGVNYDAFRDSIIREAGVQAIVDQKPFMSAMTTSFQVPTDGADTDVTDVGFARTFIVTPVFSDFVQSKVVGSMGVSIPWETYFIDILPEDVGSIDVVVNDACGSAFTFRLLGKDAELVGEGDLHDRGFNDRGKNETLSSGDAFGVVGSCDYTLGIYPTSQMKDGYVSDQPVKYAVAVSMIFIFTALVFLVYDWAVQLRQNKVLKTATRTQAIVSSLFPKNVQERIFKDAEDEVKLIERARPAGRRGNRTKDQLRNFLADGTSQEESAPQNTSLKSKPIADLFPEATVIFADIVGFTAWSSTREPTQVFTLLENIYHSFDEIAKRRRIFKVETVGDCYVAVSGLPEPRKDHAVAMARFAKDILSKFREMVKHMVVELGPDTEDLGLRIGIHSGPVTAGVLRGERARFQLFGDTMNTTARMESTGGRNKVQLSQETADLLIAAGKTQWLTARLERVNAKGKGELQTYWLELHDDGTKSTTSAATSISEDTDEAHVLSPPVRSQAAPTTVADKHMRLISWNTDILARLLTQIVARRESYGIKPDSPENIRKLEDEMSRTRLVLSEVTEIVNLPQFESTKKTIDPSRIELSEAVVSQLNDYVSTLSAMYRENPFHNFEHASHVTMSVLKLLSRIVAPADLQSDTDKTLHDHTYGITSDPMTQFAVVLSALIHDADHPGVPNSQLINENADLAAVYNNKSIAEQNSVDLAWDLLMDDAYADLRRAIYVTEEDFLRFRQLVVNVVLATDIMDKDLGALRKGRWNKAFAESPLDESSDVAQNRKATIVMEHLIQASDVAHTMQHWHIYRKWNQRLFLEMYKAYKEGRAEKDPSDSWFEGEKGFFDFYIIPLAKKLKDCGVFGVASDEYLQYAQQNRKEWELKGKQVVAEMMEAAVERQFGATDKGTANPRSR